MTTDPPQSHSTPHVPLTDHPATDRSDSVEGWEQLRRSVAMLSPGAWALRREQALEVLTALVRSSRP